MLKATAPVFLTTAVRSSDRYLLGGHTRVSVSASNQAIGRPLAHTSTIGQVLACANTEGTPTTENLRVVRQATRCLVNQERARNNELPPKVDRRLQDAAQRYSEQMVGEDYFGHITPSGETPLQRVRAIGYIPNDHVGYIVGENIAWGTLSDATPRSIVEGWIASPITTRTCSSQTTKTPG